jgi:hypothetical protein
MKSETALALASARETVKALAVQIKSARATVKTLREHVTTV